jgi:hypothetical protein
VKIFQTRSCHEANLPTLQSCMNSQYIKSSRNFVTPPFFLICIPLFVMSCCRSFITCASCSLCLSSIYVFVLRKIKDCIHITKAWPKLPLLPKQTNNYSKENTDTSSRSETMACTSRKCVSERNGHNEVQNILEYSDSKLSFISSDTDSC